MAIFFSYHGLDLLVQLFSVVGSWIGLDCLSMASASAVSISLPHVLFFSEIQRLWLCRVIIQDAYKQPQLAAEMKHFINCNSITKLIKHYCWAQLLMPQQTSEFATTKCRSRGQGDKQTLVCLSVWTRIYSGKAFILSSFLRCLFVLALPPAPQLFTVFISIFSLLYSQKKKNCLSYTGS